MCQEDDASPPAASRPAKEGVDELKSDITLRNQLESPLLRLPGEVRNEIYAFVLSGVHRVSRYPQPNSPPANLGIITASRQLYAETKPLLFKFGIFAFYGPPKRCEAVEQMGKAQRAAITAIEVGVASSMPDTYRFEPDLPSPIYRNEQDYSFEKMFPSLEMVTFDIQDYFEYHAYGDVEAFAKDVWQWNKERVVYKFTLGCKPNESFYLGFCGNVFLQKWAPSSMAHSDVLAMVEAETN